MTNNQLRAMDLVRQTRADSETRRSNMARETETSRSNRAKESETHRSNRVNEMLNYWKNSNDFEVRRQSNRIAQQEANEKTRSNLASEANTRASIEETRRANMARENETRRFNSGSLSNTSRSISETQRHNLATESNQLLGTLTNRESVRNTYSLGIAQLTETARSHRANEDYNLQSLSETNRANLANENLKGQSNLIAQLNANTQQTNAITRQLELEEQHRHNVVSEILQGVDSTIRGVSLASKLKGKNQRVRIERSNS